MSEGIKTVVITGSTRGIGFGLAREFLRRGHQVILCGRDRERTARATAALESEHGPSRTLGLSCDVRDYDQVQSLWDAATARFGAVDIWVNNAGLGTARREFWELSAEMIGNVVSANVLGVMYGSKVAMQGMLRQGSGQIYNMEGLGSDGIVFMAGVALYGATKSALTYFTKALIKDAQRTSVRVCFLSPGMVLTELFTGPGGGHLDDDMKRIANILADRVETVTPYLVRRILANDRHGARINWLTRPKIVWRFTRAPFVNRDLFAGTV
jgi:NAD(P)-dependent dehydrogenase (short-subunit alcohol dehydrogenase family)